MKYAIMVTVANETFVDGHYSNEDDAKEVFKRWEQTYPQLKFDFCAVVMPSWTRILITSPGHWTARNTTQP